jgi:hypothetical protein
MIEVIKNIETPISIYVAKAAWIGVGSQDNFPEKGKWQNWLNEVFTFIIQLRIQK